MLTIACPECSTKLKAPNGAIGKKVQCTGCGHGFVLARTLLPNIENEAKRTSASAELPATRRESLRPLILSSVAGVAILVVLALIAFLIPRAWLAAPVPAAKSLAAERLESIPDAAERLQKAQDELATLSQTYDRERSRVTAAALEKRIPDESRGMFLDIINGKTPEVVMANQERRAAAEDRGLAPEDQLANIKGRTERMKRVLEVANDFRKQLEDPQSAVSREIYEALELLDSTRKLRNQEKLVARLRQEASKTETP